jgi:hypothetical protein
MHFVRPLALLAPILLAVVAPRPAQAFFHLWRFTEVFSTADGDVQFIELAVSSNGENFAQGATITSSSTGQVFTFPENLAGNTANKRLLIATSGFGSLAGAVTPDYTLPSTEFFNPAGDTLTLFLGFNIDVRPFASVPTDGVMSRHFPANTLAANSPTNYAGNVGSVNVAPPAPAADFNGDRVVDAADLSDWQADFGLSGDSDADGDLDSDGADFLIWQRQLGQTSVTPQVSAIPEPGGGELAGLGSLTALAVAKSRCARPTDVQRRQRRRASRT